MKYPSIVSEDEKKKILIEFINVPNEKFGKKYDEEDHIVLNLDKIMESKVKAIINLESNKTRARINTTKYELILKLLHKK